MGVLGTVVERRRPASNEAGPPRGIAGGFPVVPTTQHIPRKRPEAPKPRRRKPTGSNLLDEATTEANARTVAAMSATDVEEALTEARAVFGASNLIWLRERSRRAEVPTTPRELEAAVADLPQAERSSLQAWTAESDEIDGLVAATTGTPAAKRYAIVKLREMRRPSKVGKGLAAGLWLCLDDGDVERARQEDKYAVENLRDALRGLSALTAAVPKLSPEQRRDLNSVTVSTARCVSDELRSWAIGLAIEQPDGVFLEMPKARELLASGRPDFEELCLRAWAADDRPPPPEYFADLSPSFVVRAAKFHPGLVELAATYVGRVPPDDLGRALLHPSDAVDEARRSVAQSCSRAVALRLYALLDQDCKELLEADYGDDFEAARAGLEYLRDRDVAATPPAVVRAVERAEDAWSASDLHELAAVVMEDDSRYLFALATLTKHDPRGPRVAALAAKFAAEQGFVSRTHLDGVRDSDLPPPKAWLLAPMVHGDAACLRALERGNRYTDKLPPGLVLAHVACAVLDGGLETPLLISLVAEPDQVAAAFDEIGDGVAAFADRLAARFLETGPSNSSLSACVGVFLARGPVAARKVLWRTFAGFLRLVPVGPLDAGRPDPDLDDDLALALAAEPDDDHPPAPARDAALHLLAASLARADDFHRRSKLAFLRAHARNPHRLLPDLEAAIADAEATHDTR